MAEKKPIKSPFQGILIIAAGVLLMCTRYFTNSTTWNELDFIKIGVGTFGVVLGTYYVVQAFKNRK